MTAPRYGVVEGVLQIFGIAQTEARASGRVQSEYDPESCEESREGQERGAMGTRCNSQEAQRYKSG